MRWLFGPIFLGVTVLTGCGGGGSPTGPSGSVALPEWSPYVCVHPFAWQASIQQPYILPLLQNGAVRGMRIDVLGPEADEASRWAIANGADDVLGIFPNEHLREKDPFSIFSQAVRDNPAIKYWEIGNEVGLFIQMSPEEYTPIFVDLYRYARVKYPNIVVIPQASIGGIGGDEYFRKMLELGVRGLAYDPDPNMRLSIIAVHYYSVQSPYLANIKRQIESLPADTEIWVTEAGINAGDPNSQVEFVQTEYRRLRNMLKVSRIYWYVFSECSNFSLVNGLADVCDGPITFSRLYSRLIDRGGQ